MALVKNLVHQNASKHIEVQYRFVWDCVTNEKLSQEKVFKTDNVANAMTKNLSTDRFRSLY
jgi:molybdenum-dependent DNA-binding transcriptional regulator ModE